MFRCIYCKGTSISAFPREHVLPGMFGRFEQNLTLDCVCGPCNNYFSKLELSFGRDSPEAVARLSQGLKPVSAVTQLGNSRLRQLRVVQAGFHHDAHIQYACSSTTGALLVRPVPQVGFRRGDETVWFEEAELSAEAVAPFREGGYIRFLLGSAEVALRLTARLAELGIKVEDPQPLEPPLADGGKVETVTGCIFDNTLRRVVAKIAFNYAACVAGFEFVLQSDFDAIRSFIRYEIVTKWNSVVLIDPPFRPAGERHSLAVRWMPQGRALLGLVSLFDSYNYLVSLCDSYSSELRPLLASHEFSLKTRACRRTEGDLTRCA